MEVSPLTQQSRPETFKPKIAQLYENLFNVSSNSYLCGILSFVPILTRYAYVKTSDYADPSEGFWREFFLLSPDKEQLQRVLDQLSPDDLLDLQVQLTANGSLMLHHRQLLLLVLISCFPVSPKLNSSLLVQRVKLHQEFPQMILQPWR